MRGRLIRLVVGLLVLPVLAAFLARHDEGQAIAEAARGDRFVNQGVEMPPAARSAAWTEERFSKAAPMPVPDVDPDTLKEGDLPAVPDADTSESARDMGQGDPRISGNPGTIPFKWAGRLFFRVPGGDKICSAQFISPRVILTAAHCIRDWRTGKTYDQFVFKLQYHQGRYSQQYGVQCVATNSGWIDDHRNRHRWDFGMLLARGTTTAGYFGWRTGWSANEYPSGAMIGYPGDIFGGQVVQVHAGPLSFDFAGIIGMRHGNPYNHEGASGGAWLGRFSQSLVGNANRVISVTSFHAKNDLSKTYGPLFNTYYFKGMLDFTSRGCR